MTTTEQSAATVAPAKTGAIRAEALVKQFGKKTVVDNVKLSVSAGEIVGLLGPNGAGKTTSFYMIVGLIKADSGKVMLDDTDITPLPMHKRARNGIGYLPQEPSIFRRLTVEQNLMAVAETLKISSKERKALVAKQLEDLSLTRIAKQKAYTLSGGERRRLEIARALITSPRFLLLDEPFSGVDPISVADVQSIVVSLKQRGIGVLITDHNVRETLRIVDRAYLLYQGKVLVEGTSDFLINDAQARKLYLGESFSM